MKTIQLTQDKQAIVDDEDYEYLIQFTWRAMQVYNNSWYAVRSIGKKNIYMHRDILKPGKKDLVDHINYNGLDNRRENIRISTNAENAQHSRKLTESKVLYKGVNYVPLGKKKYSAMISKDRKQYYLGVFNTSEEAARAYDKKAIELHNKYAVTNKDLGLLE